MKRSVSLLCVVLGSANLWPVRAAGLDAPDFTRDVRPLLSRHCFKCHGPDETARKSRLRLDLREAATQPAKSGAVALVPGKPGESELLKRIFARDPDEVMPPPSTKNPLTVSEKETLKRWIATGAEYKQHWAFLPPRQPAPPEVRNTLWPRNAIDRFVLARLEKERLEPSPPADPWTLVRRVYLDLIGLPPTPEEADAFLQDRSAEGYEHLVDGLLSSPRYGERLGRRWMDLARYADSNGYEKDRQREIWPWRDWVIRSLNADMPFDRFTIEQIAGDMLPDATMDQIIATGFHRNTMLNEEGGIDPLEFRFHAMTDRVATTGVTWLGLTLGCAQCHTHKYDPIPQREYYQIMAFLNNADEPDLDLPKPGAEKERQANLEKAARLLADLPNRFPLETSVWKVCRPVKAEAASGEKPTLLEDGSALFAGKSPDKDSYTLMFESDLAGIHSLRLEALTDDALPSKGPGRIKHGNFVLTEITITAAPQDAPGQEQPVKIASARADVEQNEFPVTAAFDGKPATGWAVHAAGGTLNAAHTATFMFEKPVSFPGGTRFFVKLDQQYGGQHTLGRPRISFGAPVPDARSVAVRRKEALEKVFTEWLRRERAKAVPWTILRPHEATSNMPLLTVQPDDSVFASGDITKSDTYELKFRTTLRGITAVRVEALPDDRLPRHGPGMTYYEGPKGDFFMGEFQLSANGKPVKFGRASESYAKNNFGSGSGASMAIDGDPQTGWSTAGRERERHEAVFVLGEPLAGPGEFQIRMLFGRHYACSLGRFRISVTAQPGGVQASDHPDELGRLLLVPDAQLTADIHSQARRVFAAH
ncbi:MAG: DUF1549 domain-containing protein [Fimbriimonas ginsengisoli]|nr:DUF1549 domain-containing protein [Fimbriimonas ginsengisoli]